MPHTKNLQKWSHVLLVASYACLACAPLSVLAAVQSDEATQLFAGLGRAQIAVLCLLWLFKPLVLMGAFWQMTRLFSHFKSGEVLTEAAAICIKRIGQCLLGAAVISFVTVPLQSLLISLNKAAGARSVSVAISSDMILFAMAGGLIIVIGWAMREAASVAQENRAFV
ncbi:Protein of unknown function [Yoonia tamlensis]|uniref:DUF2975 domain-containing protein n=1 Tax=Yoonia tamlensis TaxID=390270 RepID=A0A1I6FP58_9RHOB|nr:DUF2975 domain-containing protein [Yoonia tamlensis]SFR31725.1 Protein of unknown function [Yoonia tamlensis]